MKQSCFRAMGCEIVVAGASGSELAAVRELFAERDALFSRFRSDSELERVNASSAWLIPVAPLFAEAVSAALAAAASSGGLVDPTLGAAIMALGYDRDFAELEPDPRPIHVPPSRSWRAIRVLGTMLLRPPGTVLDLNGVVKAMAVDAAAALLAGPGFVSAGGDIATVGAPIAVALPDGGAIELQTGGIATSGTATRRWRRAGALQHHLLDPRTLRPASSPWSSVTAVGRDCLSADIAAKAGFLLGARGPRWLDERGVAARFVGAAGELTNGCWERSLEQATTWA